MRPLNRTVEGLMRAAFVPTAGTIEVADFAVPRPSEGQVVVEMRYASICGSDVHMVFDGMHDPDRLGKPGYPGHEGVGIVVASRSPRVAEGTAVLTVPLGHAGGCFAEFQVVGERQLVTLPAGADLRRLLPAQQLGTTIFALKRFLRGRARPQVVAILGAGSAGLFFLQQMLRLGSRIVVMSDLTPGRLAIAKRLGATRTVHAPVESVVEVVRDLTDGVGADLVIEAAGYDSCRAEAVEMTRDRGTVGLFGYPERTGLSPFPVHRAFRKALTVEWISGTQQEAGLVSFKAAVEHILRGDIEVGYCLETAFSLEETPAALEVARNHGNGSAKIGIVLPAGAR
jgi:L-iditol 2-dehydrogenase